jgi:hypothetical protein
MSRPAAVLLVGGFALVVTFAVVAYGSPFKSGGERVVGYGQIKYQGAGPERWAARYRHVRAELVEARGRLGEARRRLSVERRVVLHDPEVVEAINLACATYGYCSTLWSKARCETGGTFDPRVSNPSGAAGLFEFMPSTWSSTPYGRFSVWSPYASALAAGWMHSVGRGSEWACR